jgi:hypothetical protein
MQNLEFTRGQIKPIECVREAWALIKNDYWLLFAISIVGAMIGGISMYVLIGAMVCGIFICYLKKIDGGKVVFDDLWKGFGFFWPSLLLTIVIVVPMVIWMIIMFATLYLPIITAAVMGNKADGSAILAAFAFGLVVDIIVAIVMICIHSLLIFAFPLLVDRRLSSWEAMKLSARAALKNIGGIAGMIGVNFLLVLAGELAFCIGLYLVIPMITAANLVAYRKVFPRQSNPPFEPPPPAAYPGIL